VEAAPQSASVLAEPPSPGEQRRSVAERGAWRWLGSLRTIDFAIGAKASQRLRAAGDIT